MVLDLKKNTLPLAVSGAALVLVIIIGLIPILSSDEDTGTSEAAIPEAVSDQIAALESRVAALESTGNPAETDPALRAEINQIVRGLVNQTSRISALKKQLVPVTDWIDQNGGPERLAQEMALVNQAFIKQTARMSQLRSNLAPLTTWVDENGGPDRLSQEMSLINQALLRLTGRITALDKELQPLPDTVAAVDRLALQVENLESAVTQLHRRVREKPSSVDPASINTIEAKLDTIIDALSASPDAQ